MNHTKVRWARKMASGRVVSRSDADEDAKMRWESRAHPRERANERERTARAHHRSRARHAFERPAQARTRGTDTHDERVAVRRAAPNGGRSFGRARTMSTMSREASRVGSRLELQFFIRASRGHGLGGGHLCAKRVAKFVARGERRLSLRRGFLRRLGRDDVVSDGFYHPLFLFRGREIVVGGLNVGETGGGGGSRGALGMFVRVPTHGESSVRALDFILGRAQRNLETLVIRGVTKVVQTSRARALFPLTLAILRSSFAFFVDGALEEFGD